MIEAKVYCASQHVHTLNTSQRVLRGPDGDFMPQRTVDVDCPHLAAVTPQGSF